MDVSENSRTRPGHDYNRWRSGVPEDAPEGFGDFRAGVAYDADIDGVFERPPVAGFLQDASAIIFGSFVVAMTLFCLMAWS